VTPEELDEIKPLSGVYEFPYELALASVKATKSVASIVT
jgi:hypothetical protein